MKETTRRQFLGGSALSVGALAGAAASAEGSSADAARRVIPGSTTPVLSRAVAFDRIVFVSGVLGTKPGSRELASADFEPQCRQVLENLRASVEAAGSSMDKVLQCTCFLVEQGDFAKFNEIYRTFFPADPPARSTVVVKELVLTGAKVEVDCVTCLP